MRSSSLEFHTDMDETAKPTELIVLDLRSRLWRSLDTVSVVRAVPSLVMEEQYLRAIYEPVIWYSMEMGEALIMWHFISAVVR